ncbi:SDR family oxidoreductase [Thermohalobacter berrensis]|uniref:dTDP-4-dehydrorhamnose reductase n=1 Tax=Thermohalobacter berrensis TaxID=99594 RepID=A0A419SUX9_9FIRM|nr:NAD(P)-dependent oxidoreductase [Thermohalobacter berrensis]RKD29017.1 hypothetical protein BET03_06635 [Thermohalobacter berrensis]
MGKEKLLLIGANGFISSRINKEYKTKFDIYPLTRKELDITNFKKAEEIIKEIKPDIIVHSAAISSTNACENNIELAYKVNVEASVNIAKIANETGAKVLFFSSEQVFNGNTNEGPYSEEDKALPNTVYGETKLKAEELMVKELNELWILRLSWMFGLPERMTSNNPNLFWKVINALILDKPISVAANEYRGITYVYDLINNLERIFNLPYGIYHFGSTNEKSTYETAVFMLKEMGISDKRIEKIIIKDEEKYKDKIRDLRLSYNKIKSFGININTSQDSIKRAMREFNFKI